MQLSKFQRSCSTPTFHMLLHEMWPHFLEWLICYLIPSADDRYRKSGTHQLLCIQCSDATHEDEESDRGPDSIWWCHLTSIGNPIVEIRWSYGCLISTMGFLMLVRWHLYIESGPRRQLALRYHHHLVQCRPHATSWLNHRFGMANHSIHDSWVPLSMQGVPHHYG